MILNDNQIIFDKEYLQVILDGKLLGYVSKEIVLSMEESLRKKKVLEEIDIFTEITYIISQEKTKMFECFLLFTNEARLVRPVKSLIYNKTEWISPYE